jgi:hypothetical protein
LDAFGKSFPRKWILYNTKIKDMAFKFSADNKKAEVSLDIEMRMKSSAMLIMRRSGHWKIF